MVGAGSVMWDEEIITLLCQIGCFEFNAIDTIIHHTCDWNVLSPDQFLVGGSLKYLPGSRLPASIVATAAACSTLLGKVFKGMSLQPSAADEVKTPYKHRNVGNLVLLKENYTPPLPRSVGRITFLHTGSDQLQHTGVWLSSHSQDILKWTKAQYK